MKKQTSQKRQTVVITGATGDIGSAITDRMIRDGFFVIASGRSISKGRALIRKHGAENISFHAGEITKTETLGKIFTDPVLRRYSLAAVVACAGILEMYKTASLSRQTWQRTIDTNLTGVFLTLQAGLKKMLPRKQGLLIAIGSRWGDSGAAHAAAYAASKAALKGLIRSMQLELKDTGIRPVLVSPGSVAGSMSSGVDRKSAQKYISPAAIADLISYVVHSPANVIFEEIKIKAYRYDLES